jgi:hypothetical protein
MTMTDHAEHTLNNLRQKRDALVAHGIKLGEERAKLAFSAHAEADKAAQKRLDAVHGELGRFESELKSVDEAIGEATKRLAVAERAEAKEAERARAVQMRAQLKRLRMAGQAADGALAVLVGAAGEIHKATDELHRLGCPSPTGQQILSFGERAIRSAIQQTVWSRCIERLASSEKTTFGHVISQWATAIENRLGEAERTTEAA